MQQRRLAGAVMGLVGPGQQAAEVGDVDDRRGGAVGAGRRPHQRRRPLHAEERRPQVQRQDVVPGRGVDLLERSALEAGGAVDQKVEAAEALADPLEQAVDLGRPRQVGAERLGLDAEAADLLGRRFRPGGRAAVVDRDGAAAGRQAQGDLTAQAARGAGHQGNAAVEVHHRLTRTAR